MIISLFSATIILFTILSILVLIIEIKCGDNPMGLGVLGIGVCILLGWALGFNVIEPIKLTRPITVSVTTRPNFLTLDTDTESLMTITDVPTYNLYANSTNKITIYQRGGVNHYYATNWHKQYTLTNQ